MEDDWILLGKIYWLYWEVVKTMDGFCFDYTSGNQQQQQKETGQKWKSVEGVLCYYTSALHSNTNCPFDFKEKLRLVSYLTISFTLHKAQVYMMFRPQHNIFF